MPAAVGDRLQSGCRLHDNEVGHMPESFGGLQCTSCVFYIVIQGTDAQVVRHTTIDQVYKMPVFLVKVGFDALRTVRSRPL